MCLILLANHAHETFPTIVVANRDEYYERPTTTLDWWADHPNVLAGRDQRDGGTWMGVNQQGRWAAITNYRRAGDYRENCPSRGALVANYLTSDFGAEDYLALINQTAATYNGFNLLIGDNIGIYYFSNRNSAVADQDIVAVDSTANIAAYENKYPHPIWPGFHTLSNDLLNTMWPKTQRGSERLCELCESQRAVDHHSLIRIVRDEAQPDDSLLPDTGVGIEKERMLSPMFITTDDYGTRSSTSLTIDRRGNIRIAETSWPDQTVREFTIEGIEKK